MTSRPGFEIYSTWPVQPAVRQTPVPAMQAPKERPGLRACSAVSGRDAVLCVRGWTRTACSPQSPLAFSRQQKPTSQEAETRFPWEGSPDPGPGLGCLVRRLPWADCNYSHMCLPIQRAKHFPTFYLIQAAPQKTCEAGISPPVVRWFKSRLCYSLLCSFGAITSPL